jgi:tripartite-type tricarboxylate transporter receptor subunit TctC
VPFALVVNPQLGVTSVEQFVAAARAKADAIGYGSAGNGSVNHLLGVMFGAAAGVQMLHVPYKGAAPAITDLIGGQVQAVFTSLPSVAGFIQRGQLRALAVTSPARSPAFPDVLSGSPERFAELLREDLARWARVVRQSGAQVD